MESEALAQLDTSGSRDAVAKMTKILLVEDSKFLRLATERALTRAGYEVSSAQDGPEALLMAREKLPNLILLDMLLPKMTGPDVLKALKSDPATKEIPVVVMSGLSQRNAGRLGEAGAIGFLEKNDLALDQGPEKLLTALRDILKKLTGEEASATSA
jgi:CheY-like chemotaxis protein